MDEFIRQLPHENQLFQDQWPKNLTKLHKFSLEDKKHCNIKVLKAIFQYVHEEKVEFHMIKGIFVRTTIEHLAEKETTDLESLVEIFARGFAELNCYHELTLIFIESIYGQFQIGARIASQNEKTLVEKIFTSLKRQNFHRDQFQKNLEEQWKHFLTRRLFSPITSDKNRLDSPEVMNMSTTSFQHLFK